MSTHESPVDHFSDEAIQVYTALLEARTQLAGQSIANRRLIDSHAEWLQYDSPLLAGYRSILSTTVDMYVRGYHRQGRTDTEIKSSLLPRLRSEHRLFVEEETKLFWANGSRTDRSSKLYAGLDEDGDRIKRHVAGHAVKQPLREGLKSTVHRISLVIVDRANHDRG